MDDWKQLRDLLLEAPDGQLDACVFPLIKKWNDKPTSLQVLEVLDMCIYGGLASGFTISLFEIMIQMLLKDEGQTMEDIVPLATWRNK